MRYDTIEKRMIERTYGFTPGLAWSGLAGDEILCWITDDGAKQKTLDSYPTS